MLSVYSTDTDTNMSKYLRKIVTDDILDKSSWASSNAGKYSLASLRIFSVCLYNFFNKTYGNKTSNDPRGDFRTEITKAIKTARNRIHQRRHKLKSSVILIND